MTPRPRPAALLASWLVVAAGAGAAAAQTAQPLGASGATALDRSPATTPGPDRHAPATPQLVAARKAMRQACMGDIAKFCADAQTGRGGVMKCLHAHGADLSPGCTEASQAMRAARAGARS